MPIVSAYNAHYKEPAMGIVVIVRIIDWSCYFIRRKKLSLRVYCLIVKIEDNGREEKIDSFG